MPSGVHGNHPVSVTEMLHLMFKVGAILSISVKQYKWLALPFFLII